MAINLGKPVYVFDQTYEKWFAWEDGKFRISEVPTLTKKFAGIGTREINEAGKQAIRDVYANTFKATTQPTQPVGEIKEGVLELFESNPELASIGTPEQYSEYLSTIFPNSKVKDIVYRGGEKTDTKLFQYFTKNPSEAYMYSKANITKGGNITERNPIPAIDKQAKEYLNNKYGQGNGEILLSDDDFAASIYYSSDPEYLDLDYNLTKKGQEYFNKLQEINNRKKELLKTIDKKDIDLLNDITTVKNLYDTIKIESEDDLTKPYDDTDYQNNIGKYDKARKYIDDTLGVASIRQDIGKITANIINITNPYKDEIIQEDLTNDRDAYKNGHDGAFLMDGDHFLVKSNTNQIHELGAKQDIEGFKNFVSTQPTAEPLREEDFNLELKDRITILEAELADLEQTKQEMLDRSVPVLIATNLPKIKPDSARRETGVAVGTSKDINPGLLSNNGVSVEKAAEMLSESLFYEGSGFPEIDVQEIRDYIIDILQTGVNNYVDEFTEQNKIDNLKSEIAQLKEEQRLSKDGNTGIQLDLFSDENAPEGYPSIPRTSKNCE